MLALWLHRNHYCDPLSGIIGMEQHNGMEWNAAIVVQFFRQASCYACPNSHYTKSSGHRSPNHVVINFGGIFSHVSVPIVLNY